MRGQTTARSQLLREDFVKAALQGLASEAVVSEDHDMNDAGRRHDRRIAQTAVRLADATRAELNKRGDHK